MSLAEQSRVVERDIFGALVGTLLGVLVCRMALLVVDVHPFALIALLAVGAWSGGFVAHLGSSRSEMAVQSLQTWALQFRRYCLRIMLWLLGAAAVFGVLAVLTASYDVVGRIAGTAAITAVAAGLLWPFSILMDRKSYRGVGLFGAASVIAIYVLVLPSIWEVGHRGEEAALAGLIVALMMPAGLVVMMLQQTRVARVAGLIGIVLYSCILTCFLVALWYGDRWWRNDEWWETGFALAGFGAPALANLIGVGTCDRRHWRWAGLAAAVLACVMCTWGIWAHASEGEELLIVITSVAIAIAHANLAMLVPLRGAQVWLRFATIAAVAVTAVCLDIDISFGLSRGRGISILARLALASGILASCGTLALVILASLNRVVNRQPAEGPLASITVFCPKCGKKQTIPLEAAACSRCGLQINVCVEELGVDG
jgi:hypothetical protein